jgi:hypothetical protein
MRKTIIAVILSAAISGDALAAPDWVSVTDFPYNAACDWNDGSQTGTDDHLAIQAALNAARNVYVPRDCYIGTAKLTFGNLPFATLQGASPGASVNVAGGGGGSRLISASTSAATIEVVAAVPGLTIKNLGLTKPNSVTAGVGADGIKFLGYEDSPKIENIDVTRHYVGLNLSSTGYGLVRDSHIYSNVSDGIKMANATILNDFQWYVESTLVELNGGWCSNVVSNSSAIGPSNKSSQGTWDGLRCFANASGGMNFQGNSAIPIQGVRIANSFLGADGGPEIRLDTYNTYPHMISGGYLEINGSGPCVVVTANNSAVLNIDGTTIVHCKTSGIDNAASISVQGSDISYNATYAVVNSGTAMVPVSNFMVSNTSGNISNSGTLLSYPSFRGYVASNQTLTNGVTAKVLFDTVDFDVGAYWDATSHVYKPLLPGIYQVSYALVGRGNWCNSTDAIIGIVSKNGTWAGSNAEALNVSPGIGSLPGDAGTIGSSTMVQMNGTTDTIEIDANLTVCSGSPLIAGGSNRGSQITVVRVGP